MASENPNKPQQFFLKTAPLPDQPPNPYTNLYLRHHGSGINSVVLTAGPPKFIKGHCERDGRRIMFTSAGHPGRKWGLTMCVDGEEKAGWEKVEIVENGGSDGLWLDKEMTGKDTELEYFEATASGEENVWRGWMVCEWATGHPQLFWVTDKLKGELPTFCHRVRVVSEMLESVLE